MKQGVSRRWHGWRTPEGVKACTARIERRDALPWYIATLLFAAAMLFYRLGALPINLWDESRHVNSAFEMMRNGLSLVTTFDGTPDHWSTKPPLLIWLMSISMHVFGANEWAARLPSVFAALGTVSILFAFCALHLRKPFVGFIAAMVLLGARGYMTGDHGARTADYESMLLLWMTSYALAAYLCFHRPEAERDRWLLLCMLAIGLGFMTKTVQAMIFLPAILLHGVLHRQLGALLHKRALYVHLAWLSLLCAGYYVARERLDPGYVSSALANELMRYAVEDGDNPVHGPLWYLYERIDRFYWLVPGTLIAAYMGWRAEGEVGRVSGYVALLCGFYIAVVSLSATKILYYVIPVYPLLAIAVGLALDALLLRFAARLKRYARVAPLAVALVAGALVARTTITHVEHLNSEPIEADRSSLFLRSAAFERSGVTRFVLLHPGFRAPARLGYYVAPTLFYVKRLKAAGHRIVVQRPSEPIPAGFDAIVACESGLKALAERSLRLEAVTTGFGCGLYRIDAEHDVAPAHEGSS